MSCIKCDEFQDSNKTSYYRWKNANVEVRACEEHLKEVFKALNDAQEEYAN
jgi:hypothetical protein